MQKVASDLHRSNQSHKSSSILLISGGKISDHLSLLQGDAMRLFPLFLLLSCYCISPMDLAYAQSIGASCTAAQEGNSACNVNGCYVCKSLVWTQQALIVGSATGTDCDTSHAGLLQWTGTGFQGCDGVGWSPLNTIKTGPDTFGFVDRIGLDQSTTITSNEIMLTGNFLNLTANCNGCTAISRNGIWGGVSVKGFVAGDTIAIKQVSSSYALTVKTAIVSIGSTTSSWNLTTRDDPCAVTNPTVGTVCFDGSVYAGLSPDGNVKMFAMPCDIGVSGTKNNCSGGTASLLKWGTQGVSTGYTSFNTGRANTIGLIANYRNYNDGIVMGVPAAQACANQTYGGHNDWYLPAASELQILYANYGSIGGFMTSENRFYVSSTENAAINVRFVRFYDGYSAATDKDTADIFPVRCVRR
ncbi:MAG: hypothetical protein PHX43_01255 [Alphaproteobacteria bacterium]|nr:hypothetical protein [Alphaproteobacteria bacterium]